MADNGAYDAGGAVAVSAEAQPDRKSYGRGSANGDDNVVSWTCTVCSNENTAAAVTGEAACSLCAAPRPRPPPTELAATLPLAGVLLVIGVYLPIIGASERTSAFSAGFISTDIASFVTLSHTILLGAFGTVALLSRNPLFGASVRLALVLGTVVGGCGTLSTEVFLESCRVGVGSRTLPLVITILFFLAAAGGSILMKCSHRYPTFALWRSGSAATPHSRPRYCLGSLKVWLLAEFFIIVLSVVVRTASILAAPSRTTSIVQSCNSKDVLTVFVESFHMAFHEFPVGVWFCRALVSWLLRRPCRSGWLGLWSILHGARGHCVGAR